MSTFNKLHSQGFRRLCLLMAIVALLATSFAGCKKEEVPETTGEIVAPPNLIEEETVAVETTEPPVAKITINGDIATISGGPVNVQSTAGPDGVVYGHLEPGTEVTILREIGMDGVNWALTREGWICLKNAERLDGPIPGVTTPTEENDPESPEEDNKPEENNKEDPKGDSVNLRGVITARELNVRKEPNTDSKIVGSYKKGAKVTVTEKSGNWGKTDKGWISLDYFKEDNGTANNDNNQNNNTNAKGNAVIITNDLNIRSGAGTDNKSVGKYNYGKRVEILEQTSVGNEKWGRTKDGWVAMKYVYVDGTTGADNGTGKVTASTLNIRTGPGKNYDTNGSYESGDTITILTQIKIGGTKWGCTDKGWISMDYVDMK